MTDDDREGLASARPADLPLDREMIFDGSADALVRACRALEQAFESTDPALRMGSGQRPTTPGADLADYFEALAAELREGIAPTAPGVSAPRGLISKRGSVVPDWGFPGGAVSPLHFGHNTVWVRDGLGLWDPAASAPDPQALDLIHKLGPGILRFPGGTRAMRYHFDQAIGAGRLAQCDPYTGATDATPYGLDEFLRMAGSVGAEVTLVSPWVDGSPQEAAALVAYVNARPDSTVALGSDSRRDWKTAGYWAQLRADNGHPEPYGVKFLEIGNEQYLTLGTPPATSCGRPSKFVQCERWVGDTRIPTTALDHAQQVAITGKLVKQVDPSIKIGASAFSPAILIGEPGINGTNALDASSLLDSDNDPWNRRLATDAGDFFDFFVLHPYDLQRNLVGVIAPVDPSELAENLAQTIDELRSIAPSKDIAITEFGYLFQGGGMLGALLASQIVRVSIEKGALMALRHILIEDQEPVTTPLAEVALNLREPFANNAAIAGPSKAPLPGYHAMALLRSSLSGRFVSASTDVDGLVAFGTLDAAADRLAVVLTRSQRFGVRWTTTVSLPTGTWDAQVTTISASRLYSPFDQVDYGQVNVQALTGSHEVDIPAHALIVIQYRRSAAVVVAGTAALRSAPASYQVEAVAPAVDETTARRHRLLTALQGRRIDQVYQLDPDVREDIEAEAASGRPDALVTREMIATMSELMDMGRRRSARVLTSASAPSSFSGSTRALGALAGAGSPPVVIVPGLLGSSLSDTTIFPFGYGWIWANPRAIVLNELPEMALGPYVGGTESDADSSVDIEPTGAIPIFYDLLPARLALEGYDARVFPYDWRRDAGSGRVAARLANVILDLYQSGGVPVAVVAHSQGSIAARSAIQALQASGMGQAVGQLILLGPAHYGSFSAALALAGTHNLVQILSTLGFSNGSGLTGALQTMSGLYQLLPYDPVRVPFLASPGNDMGQPGFWSVSIDPTRLSTFFGWSKNLDTSFLNDRTTVILGDNHGKPTASGVGFDTNGTLVVTGEDLRGDGTVLHSCSVLPGTKTYLASGVEHSQMANSAKVMQAILALLAGDAVDLPAYPSDPATVAPPWPPMMP